MGARMSMDSANSLSVFSRGFLALENVFWCGLVHMGGLDLGWKGRIYHSLHLDVLERQRFWISLNNRIQREETNVLASDLTDSSLFEGRRSSSNISWHRSYNEDPSSESLASLLTGTTEEQGLSIASTSQHYQHSATTDSTLQATASRRGQSAR